MVSTQSKVLAKARDALILDENHWGSRRTPEDCLADRNEIDSPCFHPARHRNFLEDLTTTRKWPRRRCHAGKNLLCGGSRSHARFGPIRVAGLIAKARFQATSRSEFEQEYWTTRRPQGSELLCNAFQLSAHKGWNRARICYDGL